MLAAVALDRLVTPSSARIAHRGVDLAKYAGVPEEQLRPVLAQLGRARVLRQVAADAGEAGRYEVFHESLADAVLEWLNERRAAAERERLRRRLRRLVGIAAVTSLILAAVLALALYAVSERSKRQSARSQAFGAAAVGLLDSDPALGLSLALEAVRAAPAEAAETALRAALAASHERARLPHPAAVRHVSVSADGRELLTADARRGLRLWSAASGDLLRTLPRRPGVDRAELCADARHIVLAGPGGAWIAAPGGALPLPPARMPVVALSCSLDGRRAAAAGADGVTRIYDVATGRLVASRRVPIPVLDVQLSPDGTRVVVSGARAHRSGAWRIAGG